MSENNNFGQTRGDRLTFTYLYSNIIPHNVKEDHQIVNDKVQHNQRQNEFVVIKFHFRFTKFRNFFKNSTRIFKNNVTLNYAYTAPNRRVLVFTFIFIFFLSFFFVFNVVYSTYSDVTFKSFCNVYYRCFTIKTIPEQIIRRLNCLPYDGFPLNIIKRMYL